MLLSSFLLSLSALAQTPQVHVGDAQGIDVDGILDEAAWSEVEPVTDFMRFQPTAGGPPPGTTQVRFLQDERYLYAAIEVTDVDYAIRARVSPREAINADDQIGIYLDTFKDERSGYIFYLNALGVQQDFRRNGDSVTFSWDAVFRSEGRVTDTGYILEIAWPWRSLRYSADSDTWGVLLTRKIPHDNAKYGFPTMERGNPQLFTQAADLVGLRPPKAGTGLELLPQTTFVQTAARDDSGNMAWKPWSPALDIVRPSLDARLGITPNLGLAATLNPDFSQVEFDVTPTALNQRFAFFFQERRPFFLDGAEYFEDPADILYTRTLAEPIGGLKLSGRAGPWQLGVLSGLDQSPGSSIHERETPGFTNIDDGLALTSFARATHDVGTAGTVGGTIADKRIWNPEGADGQHSLGSIDTAIPLGGRWTMAAAHTQSWTGEVSGQSLWGMGNQLEVQRRTGVGTGLYLYLEDTTPGLRKETGFMPQSGLTYGRVGIDHTYEPGGAINTVRPYANVQVQEERNGEGYTVAGGGFTAVVGGVHEVFAESFAGSRTELGVNADEWSVAGGGVTQLGSVLDAGATVELSQQLDFETLTPARASDFELDVTLRPNAGIRLDLNGQLSTFRPQLALSTDHATRMRARMAWQFTRPLGLRVLAEHNAGTRRGPTVLSSVLLTWLHHPGTAFWLGYSEVTDVSGTPKAESRAVFAKVSVLLRP